MGEVKHTPWTVSETIADDEGYPEIVIRAGALVVAVAVGGLPEGLQLANARLIAAAPDLLEALTEARLTLSLTRTNIMVEMKKSEGAAYRWEGVPELLANRIAQCDAAINRATGDRPEKGEQQ